MKKLSMFVLLFCFCMPLNGGWFSKKKNNSPEQQSPPGTPSIPEEPVYDPYPSSTDVKEYDILTLLDGEMENSEENSGSSSSQHVSTSSRRSEYGPIPSSLHAASVVSKSSHPTTTEGEYFDENSSSMERERFEGAIMDTLVSYNDQKPGESDAVYRNRNKGWCNYIRCYLDLHKNDPEHTVYQWMENLLWRKGIEATFIAATFVTYRYANRYVQQQRALGKETIFDRIWRRMKVLMGRAQEEQKQDDQTSDVKQGEHKESSA